MRTERQTEIRSPFTGGRVKEVFDVEEREFRKEKYLVHVRYYLCEGTGEQFTTTEQDALFCDDLYSQYRNAHNIPFPDEIRAIREHYGLNYAQMSRIMGFGINQWKQYEDGTVPSESNARLILAVREKEGMLRVLESCRSSFEEKEYLKIVSRIEASAEGCENDGERRLFYGKTVRGIMNGFSSPDVRKLETMIKFIISKEKFSVCPTKLNKEMFYADFRHFLKTGHSISGLNYRAIQFGPVPEHYDTIYDNIEGIRKVSAVSYDRESVRLELSKETDIDNGVLDVDELATLEDVTSELCPLKTADVVARSHEELAWADNEKGHGLIAYSYAYFLK